jgi:phosphoserine aminotransferase
MINTEYLPFNMAYCLSPSDDIGGFSPSNNSGANSGSGSASGIGSSPGFGSNANTNNPAVMPGNPQEKSNEKPADYRPYFSCGPCAKPRGYRMDRLDMSVFGRNHRTKPCARALESVIDLSRIALDIPDDYVVMHIPGSDTGAVEAALWNFLGIRTVDIVTWEYFGWDWRDDLIQHLGIDHRDITAPFGRLPDLSLVDSHHDVVFCWNGTTSGVMVPDLDWISDDHQGLVICDATSYAFAAPIDWAKLDVVTWSWQKGLGSEAAHGMLALSPKAMERLKTYTPAWPIPKLIRLKDHQGNLIPQLTDKAPINTPSMLAAVDAVQCLQIYINEKKNGLIAPRVRACYDVLATWVDNHQWIDFLVQDETYRSTLSVTLKITDPEFLKQPVHQQWALCKMIADKMEASGIAFDFLAYRRAPAGLRFWCGPTVCAQSLAYALDHIAKAFEAELLALKPALDASSSVNAT